MPCGHHGQPIRQVTERILAVRHDVYQQCAGTQVPRVAQVEKVIVVAIGPGEEACAKTHHQGRIHRCGCAALDPANTGDGVWK